MYDKEGIIANARQGAVVIDLTSADASSTQKLAKQLETKGVDMLDAPVSGGNSGAASQALTIMVGGKKEVFDKCRPIFDTIGNPEKVMYIGPSGAGDIIKSSNNFLSCCCLLATTEAVVVAVKNGIDPQTAIEVIASSGGKSDASMRKYPKTIFPGNDFYGTLNMMLKDIGLFTQAAKDSRVPAFIASNVYQCWNACANTYGGESDMANVITQFEQWCDVKLRGIS